MSKALDFYKNEIINKEKEIKSLNNIINIISIVRLAIVILTIGVGYYFYKEENIVFLISSAILGFLLFIIVAIFHNSKIKMRKECELYININKRGIDRINGNFKEQEDKGEEFLDDKHPFISDLDVFGRNSLFQMINSTRTKFGREKLSKIISLKDIPNRTEIVNRQEAIKELGEKVNWRQELEVRSTFNKSGKKDIDKLLEWASSKKEINLAIKIIPYIFIAITILAIILVALRILPITYMILVFMINYVVVKVLTKDLGEVVTLFGDHKKDVEAYTNILSLIEKENLESDLLRDLKKKLVNNNKNAIKEMKDLKSLVDWLGDSSSNAYYLILNVTIFSSPLF